MTSRSRLAQSVVAGVGVFAAIVWPVVVLWRAGASGSVGDLSEVRFLGVGLVYSVVLAVIAGVLMHRHLRSYPPDDGTGRFDHWAGYVLGLGVLNLTLTAVPALILGLLVTDEHQSLRSREWLIMTLWIVGHGAAALLALAAARALLRPHRVPSQTATRAG